MYLHMFETRSSKRRRMTCSLPAAVRWEHATAKATKGWRREAAYPGMPRPRSHSILNRKSASIYHPASPLSSSSSVPFTLTSRLSPRPPRSPQLPPAPPLPSSITGISLGSRAILVTPKPAVLIRVDESEPGKRLLSLVDKVII